MILFLLLVFCEKSYGDATALVVSVYDGDTFTANIPGYPPIVGDHVQVRVRGIDTPEMASNNPETKRLALKARDRARELLLKADKVVLCEMGRDKYFRINAKVIVIIGKRTLDLSNTLLVEKLARPYDGGTKVPWP